MTTGTQTRKIKRSTLKVNLEQDFGTDLMQMLTELCSTSFDHEIKTPFVDSKLPASGVAKTKTRTPKSATPATGATPATPATSTPKVESTEAPTTWVTINLDDSAEQEAELPMADREYDRPNGEKYYARKWGEHTDVEVLRKARGASQYVMLYGNPGTGKTALVEASFPDELYTILGSGDTEVSDLVGSYVQTPSGNFEWVDGALVKSAEEGKVLLIDEIGLIDPKVLSVVYSLIDGRKELTITSNPERGTIKAKEGFYVVSATNPNAVGVRLSEALLSRFTIQTELTTDWDLARTKLGVSETVVVASKNLSKKMESGETSWSPQMRELLSFKSNEEMFGTKWSVENLIACSPEMDRPLVADVFSRVYGETFLTSRI
tara:strand:- start:3809 stop:4939 length:1131 start_codon:yes stop_codon:yes gene_type:complete